MWHFSCHFLTEHVKLFWQKVWEQSMTLPWPVCWDKWSLFQLWGYTYGLSTPTNIYNTRSWEIVTHLGPRWSRLSWVSMWTSGTLDRMQREGEGERERERDHLITVHYWQHQLVAKIKCLPAISTTDKQVKENSFSWNKEYCSSLSSLTWYLTMECTFWFDQSWKLSLAL